MIYLILSRNLRTAGLIRLLAQGNFRNKCVLFSYARLFLWYYSPWNLLIFPENTIRAILIQILFSQYFEPIDILWIEILDCNLHLLQTCIWRIRKRIHTGEANMMCFIYLSPIWRFLNGTRYNFRSRIWRTFCLFSSLLPLRSFVALIQVFWNGFHPLDVV